jgi:RNA polymerase sigma-70 factor (ECF subfamily)
VPSDQDWPLRLKDVSEAIDRLPQHMRQALMLVVSGRSYVDAAKDCGCEIGTIKSRVSRARMALMVALDETSFSEAATR